MQQETHILHLTLSFATGGRRVAIENLVKATKSEHKHFLVVLNDYEAETNAIAPLFQASLALQRTKSIDKSAFSALRSFVRKHEINIIHAHDAASQFFAALLRLSLPSVNLIMTFHRSLGFESASFKDKIRNAFSCWMSAKVICTSTERQAHFLSENFIPRAKVQLIPLGIDSKKFTANAEQRFKQRQLLSLDEGDFAVVAIGHFGSEKGIDNAISAFMQFCRQTENSAQLFIIGKGDEGRTALMKKLSGRAEGHVHLLGYCDNIPELLTAMDCFLHTPRMEAFGLVLIEAMACELPVIATAVGGIADIVLPEETGYLLTEGDEPAIVNALANLADNRQMAQQMGKKGRDRVLSEFETQVYAQRHTQLYQQLLSIVQ